MKTLEIPTSEDVLLVDKNGREVAFVSLEMNGALVVTVCDGFDLSTTPYPMGTSYALAEDETMPMRTEMGLPVGETAEKDAA